MSAPVRSALRRLLAGLLLTALVLAAAEFTLRRLRGPVPPPPLVRQLWDPGTTPFRIEGGRVFPSFQDRDAVPDFPEAPTPGVPRVLVFGESSVRGGSGLPASEEFPALLQADLAAAGHPAEVLNLGRVGMDSHSIRELVHAAVRLHPAAAVLYYGHNDVGNAFFLARYASVTSARAAHLRAFFQQFWVYAALRDLVVRPPASADAAAASGGSQLPTPLQRDLAVQEYGENLEISVRELQRAGANVVLVTPISRDGVWETMQATCGEWVPRPAWTYSTNGWRLHPDQLSRRTGEDAVARAPTCPDALFLRGWWKQEMGDVAGGWADLRAAREADPRPIRASAAIVEAMRGVAERTGARIVDLAAAVGTRKARETDDWFIDPVHPSATGHQRLAASIAATLSDELPPP